jgi:hypothetical protein
VKLAIGGQLKLSQWRRRDHELVILNFGKQIIMSTSLVCLLMFLLAYLFK